MDYLYRESTISNPIEHILIVGEEIVVHQHSTIKIFDRSMNLLRTRYFYEKILDVRRITENTIAILFDGNKMVECDTFFNPISLRVVEGSAFDLHNGACVVYNKNSAIYFGFSSKDTKEIKFSEIEIYNVSKVCFMINYIPILLVLSETSGSSRASIVNIDGKPTKIEDFETIPDIICMKATEKFVVFCNRNFIQIKYKRESFLFSLNENFDSTVLDKSLTQNYIHPSYDESSESRSIFLENAHLIVRNDSIIVLNGNGELFEFLLKLEIKKILGVLINFKGRFSRPSCIDYNDHLFCLGSCLDDSFLYKIKNDENEKVVFELFAKVENIGMITGFSQKNMLLATQNAIYKANLHIDILVYKKVKLESKILKIGTIGDELSVFTQENTFKFSNELDIIEEVNGSSIEQANPCNSSYNKDSYNFVHDKDRFLHIFRNENLIKSYPDVDLWHYHNKRLALVNKRIFRFIDLGSLKCIFSSRNMHQFENEVINEEIITNDYLEEVFDEPVDVFREDTESEQHRENIVEIAMLRGSHFYFIFRTNKQLYIYSHSNLRLLKVFITKPVIFTNETKALFDFSECIPNSIYCRSKKPCFIITNGSEIRFYDATLKLGSPIIMNGWIFASSKGHIVKCKINDMVDVVFTDSLILKKMYLREDSNKESYKKSIIEEDSEIEQVVKLDNQKNTGEQPNAVLIGDADETNQQKEDNEPKNLFEDYREKDEIKQIISLEDCNILSIGEYVPFFYHPFIPMVHMSAGPDGKPYSEPINKEEAEYVNKNPALRGRTLKYSIELISSDFKLISKTYMEDNEFICDMKIVFNSFLAVCTSYPEGEDKMTKGRLHIFSLVNIVPDPKNPHITKKLKPICAETFKSPCTYCAEVRSLIAVCVGTRLMIYEFNENTGLSAVGRNEISLLCTSLFTTKNFIAISDIFNGVYLFFLRPRDPLKLHLLGRSNQIRDCRFLSGIDFSSPDSDSLELSIVAYNKSGHIHIFTYSPYHPSSKNGNLLVKRAEVNTKLDYPLYKVRMANLNPQESLIFSENTMIRISAIKVPRINAVYNSISTLIDNVCGINARNYLETTDYVNPECKSVLSERILLEFFYFSPAKQATIFEILGMDYFSIANIIETCLVNASNRK